MMFVCLSLFLFYLRFFSASSVDGKDADGNLVLNFSLFPFHGFFLYISSSSSSCLTMT